MFVTFKPIYSAVSSSARQGTLVPQKMRVDGDDADAEEAAARAQTAASGSCMHECQLSLRRQPCL